jgi:hypothetical protein
MVAAGDLLTWDREHGASRVSMLAFTSVARALASRGRAAEARALESDYLVPAREGGDPQDLVPALATAAAARHLAGDTTGALAFIEELVALTRDRDVSRQIQELPVVARIGAAAGKPAIAQALVPVDDVAFTRGRLCVTSARAVLAEAAQEVQDARELYAAAATGWRAFGNPLETAFALLGEARCCIALGFVGEATTRLGEAEVIATGLGASPLLEESAKLRSAVPGPAR